MLKRFNTPIKQGMKIGKGIASIFTLKSSKEWSTYMSSTGQAGGAVTLPLLVLGANYFLKKLSERKQRLVKYSFSLGLTSGGYLGALISTTALKALPSSFNGIIGVAAGIAVTSALSFSVPYIYRLINRILKRKAHFSEQKDILTPTFYQHFVTGLDAGALLGSAIGASFELAFPGGGIIGAAVAAALAAPLGGLLMGFVPRWFKARKLQTKEEIETRFTRLKYTLSIGSSYGTALGAVVGSFLLPGLGSLLGGMIGGGIGMAVAAAAGELFTKNTGAHERKILTHLQMGLKIGAPLGAGLGAIIGTFVFPGLGTLAGSLVGALIGCAGASVLPALSDIFFSKKNTPKPGAAKSTDKALEEKPEKTFFGLSLSQLKTTVSLGGAIGGLVGGVIGTVFLPGVGSVLGASVGAGIGTALAVAGIALTKVISKQLKKNVLVVVAEEKETTLSSVNNKQPSPLKKVASLPVHAATKPAGLRLFDIKRGSDFVQEKYVVESENAPKRNKPNSH